MFQSERNLGYPQHLNWDCVLDEDTQHVLFGEINSDMTYVCEFCCGSVSQKTILTVFVHERHGKNEWLRKIVLTTSQPRHFCKGVEAYRLSGDWGGFLDSVQGYQSCSFCVCEGTYRLVFTVPAVRGAAEIFRCGHFGRNRCSLSLKLLLGFFYEFWFELQDTGLMSARI